MCVTKYVQENSYHEYKAKKNLHYVHFSLKMDLSTNVFRSKQDERSKTAEEKN